MRPLKSGTNPNTKEMALIESMEKSGNWLFRWRSFLPLVLYALAVPVALWFQDGASPDFQATGWWAACLGVSFFGLLIRAITIGYTPRGTSGRNTSEGQVAESLNTRGIYGMVRHPLYLGNYFMWIGIVLFVGNQWFTLVVTLLFWVYYERIMFAEEAFLRRKFGEVYLKWSESTPAFFPKFSGWVSPGVRFSLKNVFKREYNGFFAVFVSFALIDALHLYRVEGTAGLSDHWTVLTACAAGVFLILRTLKKRTRVLDVEGREYVA